MPWYQVEIPESDVADYSGTALIRKFVKAYNDALSSGEPTDVSVYHREITTDNHVYLFSPGASNLAPELLRQFNATACAEEPDLSGFTKLPI